MREVIQWRTNYPGHDKEYERRKAQGRDGWATSEEIQEIQEIIAEELSAPAFPKPTAVQKVSLLELGCGAGNNTLWLAEQGYRVYGVDIAPTAIAWAQEKWAHKKVVYRIRGNQQNHSLQAHFGVGDVCELVDYSDQMFDIVLDGCCLHCLIGPDRQRMLQQAKRVLKSGGLFLIITMCNAPVSSAMQHNFDSVSRYQVYGDVAVRYCGWPHSILEEIEAAGFEIIRSRVKRYPEHKGEDLLIVNAVPT